MEYKLYVGNLPLYDFNTYGTASFTLRGITNISNFSYTDIFSVTHTGEDVDRIIFTFVSASSYQIQVFFKTGSVPFVTFSTLQSFIACFGDIITLITADIEPIITGNINRILTMPVLDLNAIVLYTLNSDDKTVNKSLTYWAYVIGNFKQPQDIKNPVIDISTAGLGASYPYNYVYVQAFKRYYYVDNVTLLSKDLTRLTLSEDVLMSFKNLILRQTAFITRNENTYSTEIYDDQVKYDYAKNITRDSIAYLETIYTTNETTEANRECFLLTTIGA